MWQAILMQGRDNDQTRLGEGDQATVTLRERRAAMSPVHTQATTWQERERTRAKKWLTSHTACSIQFKGEHIFPTVLCIFLASKLHVTSQASRSLMNGFETGSCFN